MFQAFAWFSDLLVEHAEIFWSLFAVDMDTVLAEQPPDTWDSFPVFQVLNDYLRVDGTNRNCRYYLKVCLLMQKCACYTRKTNKLITNCVNFTIMANTISRELLFFPSHYFVFLPCSNHFKSITLLRPISIFLQQIRYHVFKYNNFNQSINQIILIFIKYFSYSFV